MIMMQYTTFRDWKKAASVNPDLNRQAGRKIMLFGVKVIALFLMLYFVGVKVRQGHLSFPELWLLTKGIGEQYSWYLLLTPLLLVAANWGFEACKWQILAAPVFRLSLVQATRAVLTGLSLGFITPRSVGDYAGRIIEAPGHGRRRLVGAVLLNRLSQTLVTFFFGVPGLICILYTSYSGAFSVNQWRIVLPVLLAVFCILWFFGRGRFRLIALVEKYTGKQGGRIFKIIGDYTLKDITLVVSYAFLRYVVFTLQFILVLWLAGVQLPFVYMAAGVASVFLLKSVIPAFNFLSDLGVREFSALWAFSFFAVPENQLVTASLLVWCLNILLPALLGSVNIVRLRLNRF